ncbi:MAG: TetR/AcrR family transcriptional regulator [Pseudorhodobacter sp.]
MREETRAFRQEEIEAAAYALLHERGYAGMSMLAVAKRARASNETLYRWFGDKKGLALALVARNTEATRRTIEAELAAERPPITILRDLGPVLLELLLGEHAIALNRAAPADPTGELGQAISEAGREVVAPLIGQVLRRARKAGDLRFDDPGTAVGLYLSLLVGDLQIRRVIGRDPEPTAAAIVQRAEMAYDQFLRLCAP